MRAARSATPPAIHPSQLPGPSLPAQLARTVPCTPMSYVAARQYVQTTVGVELTQMANRVAAIQHTKLDIIMERLTSQMVIATRRASLDSGRPGIVLLKRFLSDLEAQQLQGFEQFVNTTAIEAAYLQRILQAMAHRHARWSEVLLAKAAAHHAPAEGAWWPVVQQALQQALHQSHGAPAAAYLVSVADSLAKVMTAPTVVGMRRRVLERTQAEMLLENPAGHRGGTLAALPTPLPPPGADRKSNSRDLGNNSSLANPWSWPPPASQRREGRPARSKYRRRCSPSASPSSSEDDSGQEERRQPRRRSRPRNRHQRELSPQPRSSRRYPPINYTRQTHRNATLTPYPSEPNHQRHLVQTVSPTHRPGGRHHPPPSLYHPYPPLETHHITHAPLPLVAPAIPSPVTHFPWPPIPSPSTLPITSLDDPTWTPTVHSLSALPPSSRSLSAPPPRTSPITPDVIQQVMAETRPPAEPLPTM